MNIPVHRPPDPVEADVRRKLVSVKSLPTVFCMAVNPSQRKMFDFGAHMARQFPDTDGTVIYELIVPKIVLHTLQDTYQQQPCMIADDGKKYACRIARGKWDRKWNAGILYLAESVVAKALIEDAMNG